MEIPNDLHYTIEHEWVRMKNNRATIGITDFAQGQLGDVVFVELPAEGTELTKGSPFGVVESVKTVMQSQVEAEAKVEISFGRWDPPDYIVFAEMGVCSASASRDCTLFVASAVAISSSREAQRRRRAARSGTVVLAY